MNDVTSNSTHCPVVLVTVWPDSFTVVAAGLLFQLTPASVQEPAVVPNVSATTPDGAAAPTSLAKSRSLAEPTLPETPVRSNLISAWREKPLAPTFDTSSVAVPKLVV